MSHVPHELAEEFPDFVKQIHNLKISDVHFANLSEQYHDVNREIHRVETGIEPTSDAHETELRKKRMHLKDQIAAIIFKA